MFLRLVYLKIYHFSFSSVALHSPNDPNIGVNVSPKLYADLIAPERSSMLKVYLSIILIFSVIGLVFSFKFFKETKRKKMQLKGIILIIGLISLLIPPAKLLA